MLNDALRTMELKLWRQASLVAAALFVFFGLYNLCIFGNFSLHGLSQTLIGTSGILFCLSFSLSTLSFYARSFGSKVIYRKYFGLLGYFVALVDLALLFYTDTEYYWYGFFDHLLTPDLILGVTAMGILTVMAIISNREAIPLLGAARWRSVLRLGYLALFLLVLRAAIIEHFLWHAWIAEPNGLPPVRLVISVLAIVVLFGRLSLVFHHWRKKSSVAAVPSPVST